MTTDLQPLVLLPIRHSTSQPEASEHQQYVQSFSLGYGEQVSEISGNTSQSAQMEEQGVSRHSRASNGDLVWFLSKKGQEIFRQQRRWRIETLAQRRLAIKQDLNC